MTGSTDILDAQNEIADVDLVAVFDDQRRRDLATVNVSTVGALEVDDNELAVLQHDTGVTFRNVSLGQNDVIALDPPDCHLGFVELEATLVSTFFGDDDGKHSALPAPLRLTT